MPLTAPMSLTGTRLRKSVRRSLPVASLSTGGPYALSHRGAGGSLAPDETLSAVQYAVSRGMTFIDAGDWWKSSDGGVNIMHDSTVDRTTTATGNTTSRTEAAHRALTIDSASGSWFGSTAFPDTNPPSLEQVVSACRDAGAICCPELKTTLDATWINNTLDRITATGIPKSQVLIFSAERTDGATVVAKGYTFGSFATGGETAAQFTSNNVSVVAFDASAGVTQAKVAEWIAAGLRIHTFTLNRRTDFATQQAKGTIDAVHSDDPLYIIGANPVRSSDQFSTQTWDDGMIPSGSTRGVWRGGNKFGINGQMSVLMGFVSRSAEYSQIDFTLTYETVPDTGRFGYIAISTNDAVFNDGATVGAALLFFYRPDGRMQIFRRNGGTTTQIGTTTTGATISAGGSVDLRYTRSGNTVTLARRDNGINTTGTDATARGGYVHFGVNDTSVSGIQVSLSGLSVS